MAASTPAPVATTETPAFNRAAAVTRSLLGYGVLVGPFYLLVGIMQGLLRPGFSFARHPLSVLANGDYGWVQTANFALTGLMVIAAAVGIARVVGRVGRATTWVLYVYGVCVALAAIFHADPMDGFPVGTPVGMPTAITTMGMLHFALGALGITCLGVSALLAARMLSRRGASLMSRLSLMSGLVVLLGFYGGIAVGILGIWIAVVVGWAWLAMFALYLYRVSPDPGCKPAR